MTISRTNILKYRYIACQEGHADCVKSLIRGGANLNQKEFSRGAPPIFAASQFNFVDCVKLLMEAGCDSTLATKTQSTAIVIAAQEGYNSIVKLLLPTSYVQLFKAAYLTASRGEAEILKTLLGNKGLKQFQEKKRVAFLSKCLDPATRAQSVRSARAYSSIEYIRNKQYQLESNSGTLSSTIDYARCQVESAKARRSC